MKPELDSTGRLLLAGPQPTTEAASAALDDVESVAALLSVVIDRLDGLAAKPHDANDRKGWEEASYKTLCVARDLALRASSGIARFA